MIPTIVLFTWHLFTHCKYVLTAILLLGYEIQASTLSCLCVIPCRPQQEDQEKILVKDETTQERGRNSIQLSYFSDAEGIGKSKGRSSKSGREVIRQTKKTYRFV